jgi:uncharacterized repeat protein (TIGR03847 family)
VSRQVFDYNPPERFVAGTVGQPGERTFFLQAAARGVTTSVALEKAQVAVLAERLGELLDEVRRRSEDPTAVPVVAPTELKDVAPLLEEFRVGTLALAWDEDDERVVIEAHAMVAEEVAGEEPEPLADVEEGPDVLRVRLTAAQARAFAERATQVVAAGRPPCPLCGLPLDPSGHVCPRQNGHRA